MIACPPKIIRLLVLVALVLSAVLAGCGKRTSSPSPTAAQPVPTATLPPVPTATDPPPTLRPMPTDTPTPVPTGIVCSSLDLQSALAALSYGPLEFEPGGVVGGLTRIVGRSPADELTVVVISADDHVESLEVRLTAPEDQEEPEALAAAVFVPVLDAALPMWADRSAWLSMALASREPRADIQPPSCGNVTVSLVRPDPDPRRVWLLVSALPGDAPEQNGGYAFDPALGIGADRQTVQWAFEGLNSDTEWVFRGAADRRGQPSVAGSASNSRATLTLVGPQEELVLAALGVVVLESDTTGLASANTYARTLLRAVAPDWAAGPAWAQGAISAALEGQPSETHVGDLSVRVAPDVKTPQLVLLTVSASDRSLPTVVPTPTPIPACLRVTGLPAADLSCLTAAFYVDGVEVTRLPLDDAGCTVGPHADEIQLIGDESGQCPWSRYWTSASRVPVPEDGVVEIVFAPIAN